MTLKNRCRSDMKPIEAYLDIVDFLNTDDYLEMWITCDYNTYKEVREICNRNNIHITYNKDRLEIRKLKNR